MPKYNKGGRHFVWGATNYMKVVTRSNYHSILATTLLVFWVYGPQRYCFGSHSTLSSMSFFNSTGSAKKKHCTLATQYQTAADKVSD